ncbi:hypothetical protein MMPV_002677 [Pyropia vietnamensis]
MAPSGVQNGRTAPPPAWMTRLLFVVPAVSTAGGLPRSSFLTGRRVAAGGGAGRHPARSAAMPSSAARLGPKMGGDSSVGAAKASSVVAEAGAQLPSSAIVWGSVPAGLRGTLLRMVPANPEHLADHPPLHPEDGDGHVVALSFYSASDVPDDAAADDGDDAVTTSEDEPSDPGVLDGTRVFARNRFVRTSAFNKEAKQRRRRYRSRLATPATGGWTANLLSVTAKRSAAEQVVAHAKTVLAFADRGLPYMIDGGTLVTRGPAVLGGSLSDDSEDLPVGNCLLARAVPLPMGGVALLTGRRSTADSLRWGYCVSYDEAFKPVVRSRAFPLTTRLPVRSFGATEEWFVIPQSPSGVRGNAVATAVAGRCDGDVVTWAKAAAANKSAGGGADSAATSTTAVTFTFVPRGQPADVKARVIPVTDGAGAVLEVANAFAATTDDGTAVVVVDAVAINPPSREGGYTLLELTNHIGQRWSADADMDPWQATLTRYVFDVAADALLSVTPLTAAGVTVYTPIVARKQSTRPHSAVYVNGWDTVTKRAVLLRVDTGAVPVDATPEESGTAAPPPVTTWTAEASDVRVGSPVLTDDGQWVLAPLGGGRVGIWSAADSGNSSLELQCVLDAGAYGFSDGGVSGTWTDRVWTAEECATRKKTAYEIFAAKGWNAVDSSFSGLGLNQI